MAMMARKNDEKLKEYEKVMKDCKSVVENDSIGVVAD